MPDIAILKGMLKETSVAHIKDHPYDEGKKQVILEEPATADYKGYQVTINRMPDENEVVVVKGDSFPKPALFKGARGECKRADFIIIVNSARRRVIICIEMKAKNTTSSETEIIQQLQGAQCVVHYMQSVGKHFWKQANFLENYEYRFVSLRNINVSKQSTRWRRDHSTPHDTPENMLKIDSPNYLYLNELIGAA